MACTMNRRVDTSSATEDLAWTVDNQNIADTDSMNVAANWAFIKFDQTDTAETDPQARIRNFEAIAITVAANAMSSLALATATAFGVSTLL